jgi:hypothetical protein
MVIAPFEAGLFFVGVFLRAARGAVMDRESLRRPLVPTISEHPTVRNRSTSESGEERRGR